jgi:hypothetical protein
MPEGGTLRLRGCVQPYHPGTPVTVVVVVSAGGVVPSNTLRHEVAHALVLSHLREHAVNLPWWMDEGIAQVATDGDLAPFALLSEAVEQHTLVAPRRLRKRSATLRPEEIEIAYGQAASMVRYLVHEHGDSVISKILAGLASGEPFPAVFKRCTGAGPQHFERAWQASLQAGIQTRKGRAKNITVGSIVVLGGLSIVILARRPRRDRTEGSEADDSGPRRL